MQIYFTTIFDHIRGTKNPDHNCMSTTAQCDLCMFTHFCHGIIFIVNVIHTTLDFFIASADGFFELLDLHPA